MTNRHPRRYLLGVVALALVTSVLGMSCAGTPRIALEQAGTLWYAGIVHSVYARVTDEAVITEVVLTYGLRGQEPFESTPMTLFENPSLSGSGAFYQANILPERVRHGLYLQISVANENGETASLTTDPVIHFFGTDADTSGADADPALNLEAFGADVSPVARIPKVFLGLAGGESTDFGYRTPGSLWVPLELSGFGQYAVLTKLLEHNERKNIYASVLTHLFVQDGLAGGMLGHGSADQDMQDYIGMAFSGGDILVEQYNVLMETFSASRALTSDEMGIWTTFLRSQMHYSADEMVPRFVKIHKTFGRISLFLDSANVFGDALQAYSFWQLMNDAAIERLELFERTYLRNRDVDPALVDAVDAVRHDLETVDGRIISAIRENVLESPHLFSLTKTVLSSYVLKLTAIGALKFALAAEAVHIFWEDVVGELALLRRLVAAATLEKTITSLAPGGAALGDDALALAQMKFYLGYYYSKLFLSLRNKVTLWIADFISGWKMEDSYDRLEQVNEYCAKRYAEYDSLLESSYSVPEGSLTLQQAADQGLIELESKGGYAGDAVTLIATGENEDEVTVVSRPGDVLLVKGEQGLKQSLVISKYDVTVIPAGTPAGTVLKRGLYTFCINAEGSGLHEHDRFDVTLNLEDWPYESAQQLLMLLTAIAQASRYDDSAAQHAVWVITNNDRPDPGSQVLLRQAGILSGSSVGAFPALLTNPAAGSPDTTFVMPPELRTCSLFVVALICSLLVVLLTLAGIIVIARSR